MLNGRELALATRCLWGLQEAAPEVVCVLLSGLDGLGVASTMPEGARSQRLAAAGTALFMLGEYAAEIWRRGQVEEVQVRVAPRREGDTPLYAHLRPVAGTAVLLVAHSFEYGRFQLVQSNIDLAAAYLTALATDQTALPSLRWQME